MARAMIVRPAALALMAAAIAQAQAPAPQRAPELAVIVNAKNPTTSLTLAELRSRSKLELQFWNNGQRAKLYLRPSDTPEMKILLERVYGMTPIELRKYWIGREFRGEIPAVPTVVPTAAAAVSRVRDSEGVFSVILATDVPDGVRVLAIDGKRPGEPGYPLSGHAAPIPERPDPAGGDANELPQR